MLNYSSLANDCGISQPSEKAWLSILEASFVVFIELKALPSGSGDVFFENGQGRVPGLAGILNPIRDSQDRLYIYTDNISVNDGERQPIPFVIGEELRAIDPD